MNILCWSTECEEAQQAALLFAMTGALGKDESGNRTTEYLKRIYMGLDIPPEGFNPNAYMHIVGLDSRMGTLFELCFAMKVRFRS